MQQKHELQTPASTTREDLRRKRELEEARKSGLIPAEKDEEGRDINPHIPQYIAKAPWYLSNEQPSLKHQRRTEQNDYNNDDHLSRISQWYSRGFKPESTSKKKFVKGACSNCGATTHKLADCVERPRARGAKFTGKDIAPDEYIPTESITEFEAKRDRWGGFDPSSYQFVAQEYSFAEEEERKRKAEQQLIDDTAAADQMKKKRKTEEEDEGSLSDSDESDSEGDIGGTKIKDFDASNAPVGTKDDRTRTTTRNLRIREDTAKYLINLDLDSAFYDPKTRSMRGDPTKGLPEDLKQKVIYRGDNAVRDTGETEMVQKYDQFAWEAYKHGQEIHRQAHPTQLELSYKDHIKKKKVATSEMQSKLLAKYGGTEHLQMPADLKG